MTEDAPIVVSEEMAQHFQEQAAAEAAEKALWAEVTADLNGYGDGPDAVQRLMKLAMAGNHTAMDLLATLAEEAADMRLEMDA